MAIIGKIRQKSALLVIIIGLALFLLAFIMGGYEKMSQGSDEGIGYGSVYGESIDPILLEEDMARFENNDARQAQQQQREFSEKDRQMSLDKAFDFRTEMTILEKEFEALGLDVSQSELDAFLYGTNGFEVMPDLAQSFADSITGQFNPKLLQATIEKLQNSTNPDEQKSWTESRDYYINRRKQEKYMALINQGMYVTQLEAENDYKSNKEVKTVAYVVKRYNDIPDKIKITDAAKQKYYEEHKNEKKYEVKKAVREVKYFDIALQPSKEDSVKFNKALDKIKREFATTTNDSIFVLSNSESRFYSSTHFATFRPESDAKAMQGMTIPSTMDSVFKNATIGQIVGPYQDNGATRIAKVLDFNTKMLKVRHILIAAPKAEQGKVDAAQKKADSLLALINKDNFEEYVMKYSDDPGSKDKGGVYEDFLDYEMVPEFSNFAVEQPVGKIGKVQTNYGIHIIEVLDKKAIKYPVLAVVEKKLVPSQTTVDQAEDKVYQLLYDLDAKMSKIADNRKKIEKFDTTVVKAGYFARSMRIEENKPNVYGMNTSFAENKILTLAFNDNAKVGDLCSAPIKDKDRYVIAVLASIQEKGIPTYESIERDIENELVKEEKAKRLGAQMMKKSLSQIAKESNSEVMRAEVTFGNNQITGSGYEPEIVGVIYSLKDGQTSIPVKGESGVFVVRVDKTKKAPTAANYNIEQEQLLGTLKNGAFNQARNALKKKADVIDNRKFRAAGIRR